MWLWLCMNVPKKHLTSLKTRNQDKCLRGNVKKNSIFKDIVQIGGREVNPIDKKNENK